MSTQTHPARRAQSRRPLAVLIDEATEHLADLGYHPATITGHRAFWTRLAWMAGPDGLAAPLSKELVARFLASYGVTPERIDDRLDSGPREARTAVRILLEYDSEGRISRHRQPQLRPELPKRFEKLLDEFAAFASEQRGLSPRTVRYYCWDARRFLLFLVNRKGSARIDPEAVSDFLLSLKVQPVTIGHCAVAVRAFLRFLSAKGRIPADWSTFAPPLRVWQSARLSMPWTDEMLQQLFAAVDRGSVGGKRDYAMLLLAARLGLRIGEIRTLALRDVDWKGRRLTVRRSEGGPISELPMPKDVLRALREYVDRGRPPTSAATLFVRHAAPYEALSAKSDLHGMLCKYCRRAGIEQPEIYLHGMHSLRHAFATRLFRAETPIPTLAGLLGQRSPESPRAYCGSTSRRSAAPPLTRSTTAMRDTTMGPRFRSPLKSDITALIEQKRAIGFEYRDTEKQLQRLDRFLVESGLRRRALPRRLVLAWIRKRPEEAAATQWNRIICVRQLALLLVRRGVPAFVAPSGMRAVRNRGAVGSRSFVPCVLTREEVGRIFAVAHELPSKVHNIGPYRHLVMPELFRVLFCCGLRIGEALKLRVQDVDLQRGIITVRRGKFRRDRLVPMAPALTQRLRVYARRMGARGPERPFFVSRTGDFLAYDTAREVFIEMLGRAGIACEGPRRPTLHSARHTFASHRLQEWYRTGQDVDVWLPVLTTYLGHCQIWGTHRYLHVTPEILPTIIEKHENRFGEVIPVLRAP